MRNPATLIGLFIVFFVFTSNAQQSRKSTSTESNTSATLAPEKVEEIQKKITQIEGHFQAIESKKAFVSADSVQAAKVIESGWLEKMEAIQQRLLDKKASLLLLLNDGQHE
tara:strand:+ start:16 stop:348 length:333 start_codon:yes stop_codon:yes gene_type:complete